LKYRAKKEKNKQTNKQTDKHINAAENPIAHATTDGIDNKNN